jgi:predicted nucleic acid-binding protein
MLHRPVPFFDRKRQFQRNFKHCESGSSRQFLRVAGFFSVFRFRLKNSLALSFQMTRKFYLDTSVWRDYFEDRKDNMRPLGEFAFRFLKNCEERNDVVIVSNAVEKELLDHYARDRVNEVFLSFVEIIVKIEYSKEQSEEAFNFWKKEGKKFPLYDILHSIIARDSNAILITRDRHFEEIGVAECAKPEDIR